MVPKATSPDRTNDPRPGDDQGRHRTLTGIENDQVTMAAKRSAQARSKPPSKPVTERSLEACYVRDKGRLVRVAYDAITMLKATGNYVEIRTDEGNLELHNSLADVQTQLNDPRFVQVNRSTVVNIDHIMQVDHDAVIVGMEHITLSRNYRQHLLDRLQVLNSK
jgi:DNA-binding LytR/AlgR family response regulator